MNQKRNHDSMASFGRAVVPPIMSHIILSQMSLLTVDEKRVT